MANARFWQELSDEFRKLTAREEPLSADWHALVGDENGGQWLLRPETKANDDLRTQFEYLATKAVVALRIPPSHIPNPRRHCITWDAELAAAGRAGDAVAIGIQPEQRHFRAWLEYLRRNSPGFRSSVSVTVFESGRIETLSGGVENICLSSAAECHRAGQRALVLSPSANSESDETPGSFPDLATGQIEMGERLRAVGVAAERELQVAADALQEAMKKHFEEVRATHLESMAALGQELRASQTAASKSAEEQYRSAIENARLLLDEVSIKSAARIVPDVASVSTVSHSTLAPRSSVPLDSESVSESIRERLEEGLMTSPAANMIRRLLAEAVSPAPKEIEADERTALGRNIERLRKECGWTFEQLAEITGIEKTSIVDHIWHGVKPRPATLKAYADAFGKRLEQTITVADLEK